MSKKGTLVNSKVKKSMTLAELEESDKGPVYVLNTSTGELQGQVLLSVPKKNGNGKDLLRVPKTFIPIDLTTQATKAQILDSSEFRKTVTGGLLKVVTKEYAELLLGSDQGREEQRRVQNEMNKAKMILANSGVTGDDEEDEEDDDYVDAESIGRDAKRSANKAAKSQGEGNKVSVKLQTIVNSADEDGLSQKQVVGKLLNYNGGKLTKPELAYLHKQYKDKPVVMKHLKSVYDDMKAEA